MKIKNQKGFSAVEGLLILVIIGIISGAGWYVWSSNNKAKDSLSNADASSSIVAKDSSKNSSSNLDREYKNTDLGFSFKYPDGWKLTEQVQDSEFDEGKEGNATLVSPQGMEVSFSSGHEGKGGSCMDDPADKPHNTKNCMTYEVLSVDKVPIPNAKRAYLVHYKWTASRDEQTGKVPVSEYGIELFTDDKTDYKKGHTEIGAVFPLGRVEAIDNSKRTVVVGVNTEDKSIKVFEHADIQTVEEILKSLKLL